MRFRRSFPVVVFLAVLISMEGAIAFAIYLTRPPDRSVVHGVATREGADPLIDSSAVDAFMVENLERTGIPGAILAIVKDDKILHTAGYGLTSEGAQVTEETPMPIASLSKSMTAAAIMRLVEERRLSLNDPVVGFLPELKLTDPRGSEITIRQLLNQSSGLAGYALPPKPPRLPESLAEELEWLQATILASDPGARFNYCSENYHVLARLIERVSGMPFDDFLRKRLFRPLGMETSRVFFRFREVLPVVGKGHELVYGASIPREVPNEIASGAGGVVSSANGLARWLLFSMTGGKTAAGTTLLSPQSVAAMHTASAPASNYGFGWRQDILNDGTANVHHSGIARAFTAHQSLFPDTGYGYAFVINGGHFFRVEAASFRYGLDAIMMGDSPNTGPPFSFFGLSLGLIADNLLAVVTAIFGTIGIVGSLRARRWAGRRANSSRLGIGLRFAPYAALLFGLAALPWLLSVINRGQAVDLRVIFSYWPPLCVFFLTAAVAALSVVALRALHFFRDREEWKLTEKRINSK